MIKELFYILYVGASVFASEALTHFQQESTFQMLLLAVLLITNCGKSGEKQEFYVHVIFYAVHNQ